MFIPINGAAVLLFLVLYEIRHVTVHGCHVRSCLIFHRELCSHISHGIQAYPPLLFSAISLSHSCGGNNLYAWAVLLVCFVHSSRHQA